MGVSETDQRHGRAGTEGTVLIQAARGAHVDWADSKGLYQWERKALELSEERSKLGHGISYVEASDSRIVDPHCL